MRRSIVTFMLLLMLFSITSPVLACEPNPPTNPNPPSSYLDCSSLGSGYRYGFAIQYARNGTYQLTSNNGYLRGGAPQDPNNSVSIKNSNARTFDWEASLGIDAVIIYAGGTSTVKKLNEAKSGQGFYGKTDRYRRPYKVDGINFCYDYELDATTTAEGTTSGGSGTWEISKTVNTPAQEKFAGETAAFEYTVAVVGTAGSGGTGGQITATTVVKNNTPAKAKITKIWGYLPEYRKYMQMDCGVRFPMYLKPGQELTCTGVADVTQKRDGSVTVGISTYSAVLGAKASGDIVWSDGGSTGGGTAGPVTVTDTNAAFGGPYTVSASQTWNYTVSLPCPTDPAAYTNGVYTTTLDNTAAITETSQSASKSVALTCYAPTATVSGVTAYDAFYTWSITKTSPTSQLDLDEGESADVSYTVGASVAGRATSNYSVDGSIVLGNPHPTADMVVTVANEIAPGTPVALVGCTNPLTIPAGQTVTCTYEATSDTELEGSNVLQVTLNDIAFNTTTPYDFENATVNETDECITVSDSAFADPLGTACANQAAPSYSYTVQVGPFAECGDTDYTNTASFTTNDTEASGFANWQVLIDVACGISNNCTYNATYWISHANPDPSIYDPTWDLVGGPEMSFYDTGITWLDVLFNDVGNTYYNLANVYAIGQLNVLRGAQASDDFYNTLNHAMLLLAEYDTDQGSISGAIEADFIETTDIIDNFNRGLTGPGICPDCTAD